MGRLGHRVSRSPRLGHRHDHEKVSLGHRLDHVVHDGEKALKSAGKSVGRSIMKHGGEISAVGKGAIIASRIAGPYGAPLLAGGVVASVAGSIGSAKRKKLEAKKAKKASKMLK